MNDSLDFSDLTIQEVMVVGPDKKTYTLREANGKAAKEHRNAIMASTQFGPDGKVTGLKDLASVEAKFVAACLWDEKERNPAVQLIESWPARVQKQLYEKAKELSDLGEDSPIRVALERALQREDSPISYEQFSAWAGSLADRELRPLSRLFEKDDKGQAKN